MAVKLAPIWNALQFFNSAGNVLAGGKINTYLAGTTTPQQTFTDTTGATPNANPIILDSTGRYANQIWLTVGTVYKFVLTDSANNVILTEDNISGVNDTSSGVTSEWLVQGTPTFISGTSFSVNGNQTAIFTQGRRVQAQINAGFVYGTIVSSVFTSVTTVTLVNDSGVLDNTLSAVSVGVLNSVNPSIPKIAFLAKKSSNQTTGTTVIFDLLVNQSGGTNYSISTGLFTAPITGWYHFDFNVLVNNSTGSTQSVVLQYSINSGASFVGNTTAQVVTGAGLAVSLGADILLTSGNTVSIVAGSAFTATFDVIGSNNTFFSGHMF